MRRRQATLGELVVRALAAAGLVYALVAAYAVPATLLSGETGSTPIAERGPAPGEVRSPQWTSAHARRFPGCVDIAEWDGPGVPATVVAVSRAGRLREIAFDDAYRRARSATRTDDRWVVGACR